MPNKVYLTKEQAELIHGEEKTLTHFGVKGMKWGVRKERGSFKNEAQKIKAMKKADRIVQRNRGKVVKSVMRNSISEYANMNKKFKEKFGKNIGKIKDPNSKESKEYMAEVNKLTLNMLNRHANKIFGRRIDPRLEIEFYGDVVNTNKMPSYAINVKDAKYG